MVLAGSNITPALVSISGATPFLHTSRLCPMGRSEGRKADPLACRRNHRNVRYPSTTRRCTSVPGPLGMGKSTEESRGRRGVKIGPQQPDNPVLVMRGERVVKPRYPLRGVQMGEWSERPLQFQDTSYLAPPHSYRGSPSGPRKAPCGAQVVDILQKHTPRQRCKRDGTWRRKDISENKNWQRKQHIHI